VAAALVLAAFPPPARASGIVSGTAAYQLTSSSDIPVPSASATAPQVIAEVVPPGTVVPPTEADGTAGSPLTILNTSSGFDQSQLIVALKNSTDSTGATEQLFGLSFFGNGFSKSGQLDFSLNLGNSVTTAPQLVSLTPGVSIAALQTSTGSSSTSSSSTSSSSTSSSSTSSTSTSTVTPQATVPEPMSVVLWSTVAGLALLRARRLRRRLAA
jgi:hypothetical protein